MKFWIHLLTQIILFPIVFLILGLSNAIIITAFHFIPTIDFVMKKIHFHPKLHKELFHNVFVTIIACIIALYFLEDVIALLAVFNLLLHITMDLSGKGEAIFFPFSKQRVKL